MTSRLAWLQCRAGREMAVPYGVLWPCLPRASGVVGRTVASLVLSQLCGVAWVVVVLAVFLESAFFTAGFLESATPWLSWREVAEVGPPSVSRLQR